MTFRRLATVEMWKECAHDNSVPIVFVLPTARSVFSGSPHLPLSSDGVHLAELAVAIERQAVKAELNGVQATTAFDIDVHEDLEEGKLHGLHTQNLIVVGTGDVNLIAALVSDKCKGQLPESAGYVGRSSEPSAAIVGADAEFMVASTRSQNAGALFLFESPWAPQGERRFVALAGGFFAMGTIAAIRLLYRYVDGTETSANRSDPEVPMRIVEGEPMAYQYTQLRDPSKFDPNMDLRNIRRYKLLE